VLDRLCSTSSSPAPRASICCAAWRIAVSWSVAAEREVRSLARSPDPADHGGGGGSAWHAVACAAAGGHDACHRVRARGLGAAAAGARPGHRARHQQRTLALTALRLRTPLQPLMHANLGSWGRRRCTRQQATETSRS